MSGRRMGPFWEDPQGFLVDKSFKNRIEMLQKLKQLFSIPKNPEGSLNDAQKMFTVPKWREESQKNDPQISHKDSNSTETEP